MSKTARVITNDPEKSEIRLEIRGRVEKFATIDPRRAALKGAVGEEISRTVTIIPETEDPFKILKVTALRGNNIRYELRETEESGRPVYNLTITNTRAEPGRYFDRVSLITDKSDQEPLSIVVTGRIHAAPE